MQTESRRDIKVPTPNNNGGIYKRFFKRGIDIIASSLGIIILFPVFAIMCLLVRTKLGSPIFFVQERVGKDNKVFKMMKFRTMTDEKDENGNLLPNEKRLTPFGKKLRGLSLDEIPELFNILKGDMSLIGPRPLPVRYLPLYSQEQLKRHTVIPGLSGWAQVNGRNTVSWEARFKFDIWYVENCSFLLDMRILFLTFYKVFKKEGIYQGEGVVMEAFKGSAERREESC